MQMIAVDASLRLRRYDGEHDFALPWYQDAKTLWMMAHRTEPYDADLLARMYTYLNHKGELYWIELLRDGQYVPIGDVTLCRDDLPIVIAPGYQRQGIGGRVLPALIAYARHLGWPYLAVKEIYADNLCSQRLFERAGFEITQKTAIGAGYRLWLCTFCEITEQENSLLLEAAEIHAASWRQSHRDICTPEFVALHDAARQMEYLKKELAEGKRLFLLCNPAPCGLVSVCGELIENLYVRPEEQNRGYGSALLEFAAARCSSPTLWVLNANHRALRFYMRCGFYPTGREHALTNTLREIELMRRL